GSVETAPPVACTAGSGRCSASFLVLSGCHAGKLPKLAGEMTLITEPEGVRYIDDVGTLPQKSLGVPNTQVDLVAVRRHSREPFEGSHCVDLAEERIRGKIVQTQVSVITSVKSISHTFDRARRRFFGTRPLPIDNREREAQKAESIPPAAQAHPGH